MHIEPGVLSAAKVMSANATAIATLSTYLPGLIKRPTEIVKALLAALFFSIFMEIFHLRIGPSELHFVGASAVYFTFGFLPTLFGFAIGLLLQGLFFEPQDLVHLGVNSLSLIVPLVTTHQVLGKRFFAEGKDKLCMSWANIVRFDATYYVGVVGMVGFWLLLGNEPTPLYSWAVFSASYLPLVFCEPIFTRVILKLLSKIKASRPVIQFTTIGALSII